MGAYLSEPLTNKETSVEENEEVRVASSSMQGWRVSQEVIMGGCEGSLVEGFDLTNF